VDGVNAAQTVNRCASRRFAHFNKPSWFAHGGFYFAGLEAQESNCSAGMVSE
jgi:hypothetical protein